MCGASDTSDGGPLIVVLDPDEAVRDALRFSLETEGYRVSAFGAASELLACPQCLGAACFVIDESGCDDPQLRLLLGWRRAPVILLSGRPERVRVRGRTTIVEKPLVTDALSRRIAAVLRAS